MLLTEKANFVSQVQRPMQLPQRTINVSQINNKTILEIKTHRYCIINSKTSPTQLNDYIVYIHVKINLIVKLNINNKNTHIVLTFDAKISRRNQSRITKHDIFQVTQFFTDI